MVAFQEGVGSAGFRKESEGQKGKRSAVRGHFMGRLEV